MIIVFCIKLPVFDWAVLELDIWLVDWLFSVSDPGSSVCLRTISTCSVITFVLFIAVLTGESISVIFLSSEDCAMTTSEIQIGCFLKFHKMTPKMQLNLFDLSNL